MNKKPSDILASFADEITQRVRDELGDGNVASIFVSGSLAKGEIAAYVADGTIEVYSDVDLWVVLADGVELTSARERVRAAVEQITREGTGYRIYAPPDVGVFSEDDFRSQQARPGTVDISGSHRVLYGNPDIPNEGARLSVADIEPGEALYLLENRMIEGAAAMELLGEDAASPMKRYVCYTLLKNCLDAVTAALIVVGAYAATRAQRLAALRDDHLRGRVEPLLSHGMGCVELCRAGLDDLQHSLPNHAERLSDLERDVRAVLVETWKRTARRILDDPAATWPGMIAWRCDERRPFDNLREVLVLARRLGISRAGVLLRPTRLARFSPVCALRLSGLVEGLVEMTEAEPTSRELASGYEQTLDELTRHFGFREGSVFRRGRQMYRAVS